MLSRHTIISPLILLLCVFCLSLNASPQEIPDPPDPPRLAVDYTGILTSREIAYLEEQLVSFNDTTSTQILVVITNSLNDLTIEEYADRLGEQWGVGQKGKDNGIVMIIKPKIGNARGDARISVGYGLEEYVSDAHANRIVDRIMIPYFRENQYFEGIVQGTGVLMGLTSGTFTADQVEGLNDEGGGYGFFGIIFFIIIIFILFRRNSNRYYSSGGSGTGLLTGMLLGSMMSHRGSSGSWSNFNSGSGGFGGFGGGSFGGGGASGSW